MDLAIKLENVYFAYSKNDKKIINNVNLEIKKGDFFSICGINGSGKSTLLSIMNATIPSIEKGNFSGKVNILGFDSKKNAKEIWKKTYTIFQDPNDQIFNETVYDEIKCSLKNSNKSDDEIEKKINEVLVLLDIKNLKNKKTWEISFGEKQKIVLACALVTEPEILFLDEPTANLDSIYANEVYKILKELNKKKTTIILIEHNTEKIFLYSKTMALLSNGKIKKLGKPMEILDKKEIEDYGIQRPLFYEILKNLKVNNKKVNLILNEIKRKKINGREKNES